MTLDRPKSCAATPGPKKKPSPELIKLIKLHDFKDNATTEFKPGGPLGCDRCQLVLVKDGQFTDLELEGAFVRQVSVSGGSVHQFDAQGRPIALSVSNTYRSGIGSFSGNDRVAAVAAEGVPIRGLLLDRGALRGVVTSAGDLPHVPGKSPYIHLKSDPSGGGFAAFRRGEEVILEGEGFVAVRERESGLEISLDGELIARGIAVSENGRFRVGFRLDRPVGDYQVIAEQRAGLRYLRDATLIHVVVRDD